VCYCAALPRIETATRVVILQHPRERDMPIGTARMASLCLPGSELHVGVRWDDSAALARAIGDPARPPILLYPGRGAKDVLAEPPAGPVTLVVVDGTWSQAKTVVRDNAVLQALPRYAFVTPEPSQYRIRREPDEAFVSTIEALMHVLGALEGEPERFRRLLDPLNAMVDAQLACQARAPVRRVRQPRVARTAASKLPAAIVRRWDDVVCLVAEANAWPYRAGVATPAEELIQCVTCRPATGEWLDVLAAPRGVLSPSTSFHSELDEAALRAAGPRDALVAALAGFVRTTDVVGAWGCYSFDLLRAGGGALPPALLDLRAEARRMANRKLGSLEAYAASLDVTGAPIGRGRGGRRLGLLVELVRRWRALAPG
jgi:DTW domain-containing protein YfiP